MLPQGEVSKNVPLCPEATSMLQKVFIEFVEKYGVSTRRRMKRGNGGRQTIFADVAEEHSARCAARLSFGATTACLRLVERLAPMGQKLGDEGVFLIRLHGQGGQCERDGEGDMIAHGAGRQRPPIGGMGLVDPDGGFDEPA